jgi:hypothetical protein
VQRARRGASAPQPMALSRSARTAKTARGPIRSMAARNPLARPRDAGVTCRRVGRGCANLTWRSRVPRAGHSGRSSR